MYLLESERSEQSEQDTYWGVQNAYYGTYVNEAWASVHLKCGHQYVCHLKRGHIDINVMSFYARA